MKFRVKIRDGSSYEVEAESSDVAAAAASEQWRADNKKTTNQLFPGIVKVKALRE